MKTPALFAIISIAFLALSGIVSAASCSGTSGDWADDTYVHYDCSLLKPDDGYDVNDLNLTPHRFEAIEGDELFIYCTKSENIGEKIENPLSSARVGIQGYDEFEFLVFDESGSTDKRGLFKFSPPYPGSYRITVNDCGYDSILTVIPRPIICGDNICEGDEHWGTCAEDCDSGADDGYCDMVEEGICDPDCDEITDADCEPIVVVEEESVIVSRGPTGAIVASELTLLETEANEGGILSFLRGLGSPVAKQEASGLMLYLMGFFGG